MWIASLISAASALTKVGKLTLFADSADNLFKTKDSAGTVKVLGNGIKNIARTAGTGAPGTTDTYTITLDDNSTRTFTVTNGANGTTYTDEMAQDAIAAAFAAGVDTGITITYDDVANSFAFAVAYGTPVALGASAAEGNANSAARSNHVHPFPTAAQVGALAAGTTTDGVAEGTTNLYFTAARVRDAVLTGLSLATNAAITATDTVLSAFGKIQKQISDHFANTSNPHNTTAAQVGADPAGTAAAGDAAHVAAADPHPQYLTQTEGDARYVQPAQLPPSPVSQYLSAFLAATQANTTVTPATLTGHSFTLPPGKVATVMGVLAATAAATGTGIAYGVQVVHGAGANGNVVGAIFAEANNSSASAATATSDGDAVNVAAGATATVEAVGAASVAGNNAAFANAVLRNTASNVAATINIVFRSEVAGSAVTAQVGSGATVIIN